MKIGEEFEDRKDFDEWLMRSTRLVVTFGFGRKYFAGLDLILLSEKNIFEIIF